MNLSIFIKGFILLFLANFAHVLTNVFVDYKFRCFDHFLATIKYYE